MLKLIGTLSLVCLVNAIFPDVVHAAQDYSWINNASVVIKAIKDDDRPKCNAYIEVVNYEVLISRLIDAYSTACVYSSQGFQVAKYTNKHQRYEVALRLDGDQYYRVIRGVDNPNEVTPVPYSDELFFRTRSGAFISALKSVKVASDVKSYETLPNGESASYYIEQDSYYSWLPYYTEDGQSRNLRISSAAPSSNGKYMFVLAPDIGHIALNLTDRSARLVNRVIVQGYNGGMYAPEAVSITNDGKIGLTSGLLGTIDLENCGLSLTEKNIARALSGIENPSVTCKTVRNYGEDVFRETGYNGYGLDYRWDNDSFSFTVSPFPGTIDATMYGIYEVKLVSKGAQVDEYSYVALGDSYSSGEGDVTRLDDGSSFYLPGTEARGKCHVSSRSYPFLLAKTNQLTAERFKSVACSGAQMNKDYYGSSTSYRGQDDELKGLSEEDATAKRAAALSTFSPGILKQIDFVKEYTPKVVSLTGGGNDVGFGSILTECASSVASTCSYALGGDDMAAVLGSSIKQQYASMQRMITAIREVSPKTTIYVIGYPKFLTSNAISCGGNAGALDHWERTAINQGVEYLNDVIQAAATSTGAHYVNIEDSLSGGRLCEGGGYVTGVIDAFMADDMAQAFHPNAAGHEKMSEAIVSSSIFRLDNVNPAADVTVTSPVIPSYFGADESVRAERRESITNKYLNVRSKVNFEIQKGLFKASSRVSISIHSKSKNLGTYTAAFDGSLSVSRNLPRDISTGYHTVLVKGIDPQGVPLWLYQFVYVDGEEPDSDKDGVPNGADKCQFRAQTFDEMTQRFVCAGTPTRP